MRLMTFNVLNAWQPSSPVYKTMRERSAGAVKFVGEILPDILCLQEYDYYYRHDSLFESGIASEYSEVDTADEIGGGAWNTIFYRNGRFKVKASGGYSFAANGFEVVPIKDGGETLPPKACNCCKYSYPEGSPERAAGLERTRFRSLGWGLLEDGDGKKFIVATTHFSLRKACQWAEVDFVLDLLSELEKKYSCPVILCGDFNSATTWGATKRLLDCGLLDTYDMAQNRDDVSTCHPSSGKGVSSETDRMPAGDYKTGAIDHLLANTELKVDSFRIFAREELLSVSDHCPTMIEFEI